ncbi:MAG TPA: hypothetical protein VK969_12260 [Acidimicrobiia bacterium]|nr:hypothetical protein [Acidimicrobiia bacterium]
MRDDLQVVIDVWSHPGYQTGLVAGLVGAALVLAIALILRRRVLGWGLIFAVAAMVALSRRTDIESDLFVGLAVLAAAGLLVDVAVALRWRWRWVLVTAGWVVAAGAAVWFGATVGVTDPSWVVYGLSLTIVGFGIGLWAWSRLPQVGLVGLLAAIVVAGAWVTVPETGRFVVLVGTALPMGLVTLWPLSGRPSAAGALALAGVFAWLTMDQGIQPRPWTAAASWALVASIPVMAALVHRGLAKPGRVIVIVTHLVYVVIVTRAADYTDSIPWILAWSAIALVLVVLVLALLSGRTAPNAEAVSS